MKNRYTHKWEIHVHQVRLKQIVLMCMIIIAHNTEVQEVTKVKNHIFHSRFCKIKEISTSICMDLNTSAIFSEFQCLWILKIIPKYILRAVQVRPYLWFWKTFSEKDDFWFRYRYCYSLVLYIIVSNIANLI